MKFKEAFYSNPMVGKINDSLYKAKPTVYVIGGMIGTLVSVYLAWDAGRKSKNVIEEVTQDIEDVRAKRPDETAEPEEGTEVMTMAQYRKELAKVYIRAGYKLGKVFAPAVITETAALAAIGRGYGILNDRHIATIAAFNMQAKTFLDYRNRVAKKYGEETEKELYYGYETKEYEEAEVDENGEPKFNRKGEVRTRKTKKAILEDALKQHSMYAQIFDNEYWVDNGKVVKIPSSETPQFEVDPRTGEGNEYYNEKLVKDQTKYLNTSIRYRPYHMYTLNDIYELFNFKLTDFGQVVGWHCHIDPVTKETIFEDGDPEGIKIALFPVWYPDEASGKLEKSYIMDFNVPGKILGYYAKEKVNE